MKKKAAGGKPAGKTSDKAVDKLIEWMDLISKHLFNHYKHLLAIKKAFTELTKTVKSHDAQIQGLHTHRHHDADELLNLMEDHEKRIRFFEGARHGQHIADLKAKLERLENRLQHFDALQSTIERLKSSHDDLAYRVDVPDPRERR